MNNQKEDVVLPPLKYLPIGGNHIEVAEPGDENYSESKASQPYDFGTHHF